MKLRLVALVFLISTIAVFATPQTDNEIESIRQTYAATNRKLARYKRVKKELSGFSTEGGVLTAYFDGPQIVKIAVTFYGESGKSSEEYYYRDGKLIFVFRTESRYNRPLSGRVVATTANRFYFKDDKLIRWIDENGKQVSSSSTEFTAKETDYLASSNLFSQGARSKNRIIESDQYSVCATLMRKRPVAAP